MSHEKSEIILEKAQRWSSKKNALKLQSVDYPKRREESYNIISKSEESREREGVPPKSEVLKKGDAFIDLRAWVGVGGRYMKGRVAWVRGRWVGVGVGWLGAGGVGRSWVRG